MMLKHKVVNFTIKFLETKATFRIKQSAKIKHKYEFKKCFRKSLILCKNKRSEGNSNI